MINLDDILSRVGRGQFSEQDVHDLADEVAGLNLSVDPDVFDRLGRGYRRLADLQALYSLVEQAYAAKFKRPTEAQRKAADDALGAQEQARAAGARKAAADAAFEAERTARLAWYQLAQQTAQAQADVVTAQGAADRFRINQRLTAATIAEKHAKAQPLRDLLDLAPEPSPPPESSNQG